MIVKNTPKYVRAWTMYDWANSVYSLVITSSIFPAYYNAVTANPENGNKINFFGLELVNTVIYTYSLSFAFLLVACLSPLLTGIADFSGRKKLFMQMFCYLGSFSCMGLYFFDSSNISLGIILSITACMGYSGSIVFYNSYLPDLVSEDRIDQVSAKGFTMGYMGSVLQLIFNLSMILFPSFYFDVAGKAQELMATNHISLNEATTLATDYYTGRASRLSFLITGLWWLGFAQITFLTLPKYSGKKEGDRKDIFSNGFKELRRVWNSLADIPVLKTFLLAFFFYNTGVQTVMYVATIFGEKELHLETGQLISVVLLLQIIAIGGAYFFAYLSKKKGNIKALLVAVWIWVFTCAGAYFVYTGQQFYLLAVVVGFIMGGVQALSRSTYAKLIPEDTEDTASYFSFYDVTEKLSIVLGLFSFGAIEMFTDNMRNSILALCIFFIIGMFFLRKVKAVRLEHK